MHLLTIADSGTWSLGVLIGVPLLLLSVLALAALAVVAFVSDEAGFAAGVIAVLVAIVLVAVSPVGYWPFSAEYHQWREASGTVQQIDKRLIGSGDKMEDKFVVRFTDGSQQFGCDDTRCASVREGDKLTLSCKRAWQYTGTDGYDCRFVSTEAVR